MYLMFQYLKEPSNLTLGHICDPKFSAHMCSYVGGESQAVTWSLEVVPDTRELENHLWEIFCPAHL